MTLTDILTLSKAGFTAQQISALASIDSSAAAATGPAQIPAPAPATVPAPMATVPVTGPAQIPAPAPAPAPATAPAPAPAPATANQYDEILKQLGVINSNMQTSALTMAIQPPEKTVDDVIASIINPPTIDSKEVIK